MDRLVSSEDSVVDKLYGLMPKNRFTCLLRYTVCQLRAATREKKEKDKSLASIAEENLENKRNSLEQANKDDEVVENWWAQIAENTNITPINSKIVVKEALEIKWDEVEKDQREMSFIIYRSDESTENDEDKRKQSDKNFFDDLCVDAPDVGDVKTKDVRYLSKIEKEGQSKASQNHFPTQKWKNTCYRNCEETRACRNSLQKREHELWPFKSWAR